MYRNDLHGTLTSRSNNGFLNSNFLSGPHHFCLFRWVVIQMAALRGDISFRYLKQFFLGTHCTDHTIRCNNVARFDNENSFSTDKPKQ
jgi:hypothetical protein